MIFVSCKIYCMNCFERVRISILKSKKKNYIFGIFNIKYFFFLNNKKSSLVLGSNCRRKL